MTRINFFRLQLLLLMVFGVVLGLSAKSIHGTPEAADAASGVSSSIDCSRSVMEYAYDHEGNRNPGLFLLKDCDFSFLDDLSIPGMPATRDADLENQIIYSSSQCPQGLCLTDDYILLTSYSSDTSYLGELLVFDRESGDYLSTFGLDSTSHLGGITFDGSNVWICNSAEDSIERISYDFIQLMAGKNTGQVIDATSVVDVFRVSNSPSCICWFNNRLWVCSHQLMGSGQMIAYSYDSAANQLTVLSSFRVPAKTQGIAFGDDGKVYISSSYGRRSSSYLKIYESVSSMSAQPTAPLLEVEIPPCSEELVLDGDRVMLLFESAGEKYYEGTDGNGSSLSPIDRILILRLNESYLPYQCTR